MRKTSWIDPKDEALTKSTSAARSSTATGPTGTSPRLGRCSARRCVPAVSRRQAAARGRRSFPGRGGPATRSPACRPDLPYRRAGQPDLRSRPVSVHRLVGRAGRASGRPPVTL